MTETEVSCQMIAKTCGCDDRRKKVGYAFVDSYHSLCIDKKDIILALIQACERLLKYPRDEKDNEVFLKMSNDCQHYSKAINAKGKSFPTEP